MSLQKEAIVFGGPLVLVMPVSGLYVNLDQLENEATPYFTPLATLESSSFLSVSLSYTFYICMINGCFKYHVIFNNLSSTANQIMLLHLNCMNCRSLRCIGKVQSE